MKTGEAFSLLLFDIDTFKHLNDSFGHPFGDTCLRLLVDVVQGVAIRSNDHLARLGGDEFALILTRTTLDGAKLLAQRIERDLGEATASLEAPFTISIGMATFESGSESGEPPSLETLIAAADQSLYQAKKAKGRAIRTVGHNASESMI